MKNPIGNLTQDLPTCGAIPQPTSPPRAPLLSSAECSERVDLYIHFSIRLNCVVQVQGQLDTFLCLRLSVLDINDVEGVIS